MFGFDCDHDPIAPSGGALLELLGLDARSVRDTLADEPRPALSRPRGLRRTGVRGGLRRR